MDTVDPLRFIFAFLFVVGLIGALAYGLKRYGKAQAMFGVHNAGGRLQVVETRYLDARRRLVLVKRDEVEHLLLLADGKDVVVETGIEGNGQNE
jgi:flagellar protein FliO/FliZ